MSSSGEKLMISPTRALSKSKQPCISPTAICLFSTRPICFSQDCIVLKSSSPVQQPEKESLVYNIFMNLYHARLLILFLYIIKEGFERVVQYVNLRHMTNAGIEVIAEFEGKIDAQQLGRIRAYETDKTLFGFVASTAGNIVVIVFIFGGLLER